MWQTKGVYMGLREIIIDELEILSLASKQLAYEKSLVVCGHAPTELFEVFCDDLFHPSSETMRECFSHDEIKELSHLYGVMMETVNEDYLTVSDMLKDLKWRRVMSLAKEIHSNFK